MGSSHVIDLNGPYKNKLEEIFERRGREDLLDGIMDIDKAEEIHLNWFK